MAKKKAELTPLEKARAVTAARRAAGEVIKRRNPIEKLGDNPKSLRLAINAKCYDCQGQDSDPKVRYRIGTCSVTGCPLHAVRPHQRRTEEDEDDDTEDNE
jgi:hypothetical protein